jgi:glycosyltransferase involved in cell wall biosynthesis
MRAAVDVTPLLGARTGIGELVAGLVNALGERDDVEVVPVALTWRGRSQAGAAHRPIPARLVQSVWSRYDLLPIERWTGPVDVVHGTNYVVGPPSRDRTRLRHDRSVTPRIVTVHDLATLKTPELCHPATLVFPTLVERAVRSGAFVQTDTASVAGEVVEWLHISTDRVRAIHPGVPSLPTGEPTNLDLRVLDGPFVLSLGTEDPRKGLQRIASAVSAIRRVHPHMRWVHAGGSGWGTEALNEALSRLSIDDRAAVVRLGRVTDSQRAWLLRHADVFLYPSIDEGFGFPPLEALSVGTPVIAHHLPVLQEVLGGFDTNKVVLMDTSDADQLSATVLQAVEQQHFGDALMKDITSRYSWSRMAARQVDWYRDVQQ